MTNAGYMRFEAADILAEARKRLEIVEQARLMIPRTTIITKGEHHADPNQYRP
jgi:hypothetical protein